jgi:hypothetical protein
MNVNGKNNRRNSRQTLHALIQDNCCNGRPTVVFITTLLVKTESPQRQMETPTMKRPSVYSYDITTLPGATVHALRTRKFDISLRDLASRCQPQPLEHTTIRRLENNLGFTQDTTTRVATALGTIPEVLFYPPKAAEVLVNLPRKLQIDVLNIAEDGIVNAIKAGIEKRHQESSNRRGKRKKD